MVKQLTASAANPSPNGKHGPAAASAANQTVAEFLAEHCAATARPEIERCLSVRQPWAFAIVRGWKCVENRTWAPPANFRGFIAIHASGRENQISESACVYIEDSAPYVIDHLAEKNWPLDTEGKPRNPVELGVIIGIAEVAGNIQFQRGEFVAACEKAGEQFVAWWEKQFELTSTAPDYWAEKSGHCWLLDNARMFADPIPSNGKLNLWRMDAEQVAAVLAAKLLPAFVCPEEDRIPLE